MFSVSSDDEEEGIQVDEDIEEVNVEEEAAPVEDEDGDSSEMEEVVGIVEDSQVPRILLSYALIIH